MHVKLYKCYAAKCESEQELYALIQWHDTGNSKEKYNCFLASINCRPAGPSKEDGRRKGVVSSSISFGFLLFITCRRKEQ